LQAGFSRLLGDQSELTQEMASRGVTLVYGLGDEATRKELLQGLVGVLQGQAKPIKVGGGFAAPARSGPGCGVVVGAAGGLQGQAGVLQGQTSR
jgi:hypothetical protein